MKYVSKAEETLMNNTGLKETLKTGGHAPWQDLWNPVVTEGYPVPLQVEPSPSGAG